MKTRLPKTRTMKVWHLPIKMAERFLPEGPSDLRWNGRDYIMEVGIQCGRYSKRGFLKLIDKATGEATIFWLPGRPGWAAATNQHGVVVVAMERTIALYSLADRKVVRILATIANPARTEMFNDCQLSPDGRHIVAGTKDWRFKEPVGGVYLYDGGSQLKSLEMPSTCSNGKIVQRYRGGFQLWDIDSPTCKVTLRRLRNDYKSEGTSRTVVEYDSDPIRFPDGMDGFVTLRDGRKAYAVALFRPLGTGTGEVELRDAKSHTLITKFLCPCSPQVTCPFFTKLDGRIHLIATTAAENMDEERAAEAYNAGATFTVDVSDIVAKLPKRPVFQIPAEKAA